MSCLVGLIKAKLFSHRKRSQATQTIDSGAKYKQTGNYLHLIDVEQLFNVDITQTESDRNRHQTSKQLLQDVQATGLLSSE
jgi:hypothetical protein